MLLAHVNAKGAHGPEVTNQMVVCIHAKSLPKSLVSYGGFSASCRVSPHKDTQHPYSLQNFSDFNSLSRPSSPLLSQSWAAYSPSKPSKTDTSLEERPRTTKWTSSSHFRRDLEALVLSRNARIPPDCRVTRSGKISNGLHLDWECVLSRSPGQLVLVEMILSEKVCHESEKVIWTWYVCGRSGYWAVFLLARNCTCESCMYASRCDFYVASLAHWAHCSLLIRRIVADMI